MRFRVLLAVTHLLGAGHLTRTAAIGRALARAGHDVTLVSGGRPTAMMSTAGLELVQLPPVHARIGQFSTLLDESDQMVGRGTMERRKALLLQTFDRVRPEVVLTELFPFGRRSLAPEFLALIEAAHARPARPLLACSIRDILAAPARSEKIERTHQLVERYFDAVLVHGDPDIVPLEASWPVTPPLRARLTYTGYVDADPADRLVAVPAPDGSVVVSGGSSTAALPLYRAALEAAWRVPDRTWRILVGKGVPERDVGELQRIAGTNVAIEPARADFRAVLRDCALFVGQAGYNTAVDLLRVRARAVLVPFEQGGETEQRLRAECLAAKGVAALLSEAELDPGRLADLVRALLASAQPAAMAIDLDGAETTARIIAGLVARQRAGSAPPARAES